MLKKVIVSVCVVLFYLTANASAVLSDTTDDGTGTISAHGQNLPNEGMAKAFDNIITSPNKWLDFSPSSSWIQYQYASNKRSVVTEYTLRSGNDAQERDPTNWNLLGSNDGGASWVTLDTRTGELFTARLQKRSFSFTNSTGYNIYRLSITQLRGPNPNSVQLTEIEFIGTPPAPPVPPAKATSPNPANSAAGVSTTATLSWIAGSGAKSHDVYFGTSLSDVNNAERLLGDLNGNGTVDKNDLLLLAEYWLLNPAGTEPYAGVDDDNIVDFFDYALFSQDWMKSANPVFKGNRDANSFNPGTLALNTTYYWRIDEVNGPNTITGDVWSFTTQSGKAFNPSPVSGVSNVATNATLSWSAGPGATSHNVYFGTANPPPSIGNRTTTTYTPGTLANSTTYYWRIDEVGGSGTITGDVWSFTTAGAPGDSNSLVGKIMCGYQGWFNTPTDGAGRGWVHWGRNNSFTPTTCTVDMWPDMTEYGASEKFLASAFNDGNDHYVFSPYKRDTVLRHFQWMQDYGIDGVYLQRFATEVTPGSAEFNDRNTVLSHCRDGANMYGRKYAVMYDLSGLGAGGTSKVINDWKYLVDTMHISRDPADHGYMIHHSKPVVALWGFGFGRAYEGQESYDLINFFKNDPVYGGNVVMLGVNDNWRSGASVETRTLLLADIISPWWVGRYGNTSGAYSFASTYGVPDKAWCDTNGKDYLPVMFPGFSWHNLNGGALNQIPRVGGQFLWDQVYADISTIGANMLYLAMFDEVDEGTAIFKVTNNPPRPGGVDMFVTYDIDGYPLPSDEYLWLTGKASQALRGEIPVNPTRPAR